MKLSKKHMWILVALLVFAVIVALPLPAALTPQGQVALAVMVMAVTLWVSEAVPYIVSSIMIVGIGAVAMGLSPTSDGLYGTKQALREFLAGLATPSLALVAGGLFIAVAMEETGLHKRLAFMILDRIGTKPRDLVLGLILVSAAMAFFVPSATARSGALIPVVTGMIAALQPKKDSKLEALLLIVTVLSISIWCFGIKTSAAQNQVALSFISASYGVEISWLQWLIYGGPLALLVSVALYFIAPLLLPVDASEYRSDPALMRSELEALGPVTVREKKLIVYSLALLGLWATEKLIHPIDSTTVTLFIFMLMLLPKIGIMDWQAVETGTSWGTLLTFAIGISLGTILLNTGAASWLSEQTLGAMGVESLSPLVVTLLLSVVSVLIHLGFASATSLASVFIPIVIGVVELMPISATTAIGIIIIQAFVVSFGFILPVNTPQNMLAFATGGFTARDLLKIGLPLTLIALAIIGVLAGSYWQWVGLL